MPRKSTVQHDTVFVAKEKHAAAKMVIGQVPENLYSS
jgi:hypothetical protein